MIELHRAINNVRPSRFRTNQATPKDLPYGAHEVGRTLTAYNGITVKVLAASHPFVVSSTCRIERDHWHNRVHHATVRYIARSYGRVLEYGITACGSHLTNPLYLDEPVRLCDCGKGDASVCPRCELAAHPEPLFQPCAGYARRLRAAS